MRKLTVFVLAMLLAPALSQAKTLEDLLVEKGVITKSEARGSMAAGSASKVFWNGGTRVEFPDNGYATQFNTLIQTAYSYTDNDSDSGATDTSSFDVKKARIYVSGNALHNEFSYMLNGDFVGGSDSDGANSAILEDAWIGWQACDWATVRMGQFKTGISRQYNAKDWGQQFANRSGSSDFFNLGRQQGADIKTEWMDGRVKLGAGIFNGLSDGEGQNLTGVDTNHTLVANARVNLMGEIDPLYEGDVDWTENTAADIGAAYAWSDLKTGLAGGAGLEGADQHNISVDANVKSNGFGLHGEFFWASYEADSMSESVDPTGFYVQAGYFFDPKTLEVAARYSMVDCDNGAAAGRCSGNDSLDEASATVNYYWWKHNLKGQIGYDWMQQDPVDGSSELKSNRWIVQLTSYF